MRGKAQKKALKEQQRYATQVWLVCKAWGSFKISLGSTLKVTLGVSPFVLGDLH